MMNRYIQTLSIIDRLNELNEKINKMLGTKLDNVFVGAAILGLILVITFWGIGELNRKK